MSNRPLGVEVSRALAARNVEVIFGIPGVHNVEMYRGIEEAGITHVLARHEQGAGFMADGYARATGRPGVAYVITGPGVTNILTPLGQAWSDSVPVLVVSSCLDRADLDQETARLHDMRDQRGAAATVTAWSRAALDAPAVYGAIDRAFTGFAADRARPVHVQIPIDSLGAPASPAPPPVDRPRRAQPDPAVLADATRMLAAAKRPLLVLGGGAVAATGAARRMADAGVAVLPTYAARGIVPDDHPMSFGATSARAEMLGLIGSADLVIAAGTELSETDFWRRDLGHDAPMIRIDIDPAMLAQGRAGDLAVLGDATAALDALAECRATRAWTAEEIVAARAQAVAAADAERPGIRPVIDALRAATPPETMVYSDMTQFAYLAKEIWPMAAPGHWHHPFGFGTLGYALPAAIGGKIGRGAEPVMAIAGDYGFQYTMQELGVAVELGLSLPIVIWDNGKLKEIEDYMAANQIAPNAVTARNPDFVALARAFGAEAARPRALDEIASVLDAAFARPGPTLIHLTPEIVSG